MSKLLKVSTITLNGKKTRVVLARELWKRMSNTQSWKVWVSENVTKSIHHLQGVDWVYADNLFQDDFKAVFSGTGLEFKKDFKVEPVLSSNMAKSIARKAKTNKGIECWEFLIDVCNTDPNLEVSGVVLYNKEELESLIPAINSEVSEVVEMLHSVSKLVQAVKEGKVVLTREQLYNLHRMWKSLLKTVNEVDTSIRSILK